MRLPFSILTRGLPALFLEPGQKRRQQTPPPGSRDCALCLPLPCILPLRSFLLEDTEDMASPFPISGPLLGLFPLPEGSLTPGTDFLSPVSTACPVFL